VIRKLAASLLVFLICVGLFSVDSRAIFSSEEQSEPQTLVYGRVFLSGNGETCICPQYITNYNLTQDYEVPLNAPGLRVELPPDSDSPLSGDLAVCVGSIDSNEWCMTSSTFTTGEIEWLTGIIEGNSFKLVGKSYELLFDSRFVSLEIREEFSDSSKREVDLFGVRGDGAVLAYAVCDAQPSKKTYVGKLTEFDGATAKIIVVDGVGRHAATRTLTAEINGDTKIFEGKNPIWKKRIVPGRICALYGHYNASTGTIEADTLICDLDLATDGGRVVGVVVDNNPDEFSILTSVAPCVPMRLGATLTIDTKIVKDGSVIDKAETSKIPIGTSVEVIGVFGTANTAISATSVSTNPFKPSDSVFGKLSDEGLVDFFGSVHGFDFDDLSNATGIGGEIVPGRWVIAWVSNGHVQSAHFPELGFMGVRISGYLKNVGNSNITIDCVSSMDYDLPGRVLDIGCGVYCKAIVGGVGIVRLSDIPAGSFLHCWGVPTLDGGFQAMLVNVQTIIE